MADDNSQNAIIKIIAKMKDSFSKLRFKIGSEIAGKQAMKDADDAERTALEGRLVESAALSTKASIEGGAHIATTILLKPIDALFCGTKLLNCPAEPISPAPTPKNADWKNNLDKLPGPKV